MRTLTSKLELLSQHSQLWPHGLASQRIKPGTIINDDSPQLSNGASGERETTEKKCPPRVPVASRSRINSTSRPVSARIVDEVVLPSIR
jgi:hypothetical protein